MQVLLSAPRAGSSYGYEAVHQYNMALPNVKYIGVEEYFDPHQMSHLSLLDKIDFLNSEKQKGTHYTFKHHINYLGNHYEAWFKDFYKNDEILVLKRKDEWKWFLSFLFQDHVGWELSHFTKDTKIEIETHWKEYGYYKTLNQFFDIKSQLNRCEGNVIYYEDLKHQAVKNHKLSNYINYETYFDNINDIKKEFLKLC
jgi:hypothetical protein